MDNLFTVLKQTQINMLKSQIYAIELELENEKLKQKVEQLSPEKTDEANEFGYSGVDSYSVG